MIAKIQDYLEEIQIKRTLKRASAELSGSAVAFEAIQKKYVQGKKGRKELLAYCILIVSGNTTYMRPAQRFNCVLREYLYGLELAVELKSLKESILIQKECARAQLERN